MKKHYENLLNKELKRLWINEMSVLVIPQGKDKFAVVDEKRAITAKGHLIYRHTRKLPNRAGAEKFWNALKPLQYKEKSVRKVTIETD